MWYLIGFYICGSMLSMMGLWYMNQRDLAQKKYFNLGFGADLAFFLSALWPIAWLWLGAIGMVIWLDDAPVWDKQRLYSKQPPAKQCDRRSSK